MAGFIYEWEKPLYRLAFQAFEEKRQAFKASDDHLDLLPQAYQLVEDITNENPKTFYVASGLLPKRKRRAVRAL